MEIAECDALSFDEHFGMLVDAEWAEHEDRRMKTRLKRARLRQLATVEDIDYRYPRGLDKPLMLTLSGCEWVRQHHNCIITGPTGAGTNYLACALGNKACREGYHVLYFHVSRLFQDLAAARLHAFERHYEAIAKPFQWKFTREDLARLLYKLGHEHPSELLPPAV